MLLTLLTQRRTARRYTLQLILLTLLSFFISNCSVIGAVTGKFEDKYSDSTTKEDEYAARGLAKDMSFIKSVVTKKRDEGAKRPRGKVTEYKDEEKELSNETEEAIDAYISMEKEKAIKCSQNTDINVQEYLSNDCWLSENNP